MVDEGTAGSSAHRRPPGAPGGEATAPVDLDDVEAAQVARMVADVAQRGAAMQAQIVAAVALAERRRLEDGDADRALDGLLVDLDRIVGLLG